MIVGLLVLLGGVVQASEPALDVQDDRVQIGVNGVLDFRTVGGYVADRPLRGELRAAVPVARRARAEVSVWTAPLRPPQSEDPDADIVIAASSGDRGFERIQHQGYAGASFGLALTLAEGRMSLADELGPVVRIDGRLGLAAVATRRVTYRESAIRPGEWVGAVEGRDLRPAAYGGFGLRAQLRPSLDLGLELGGQVVTTPHLPEEPLQVRGGLTTGLGLVWVPGRA